MNFQQLEETLTRLESVDAVRVVADGDRISEVHVLAAPSKSAKQVVRDVQSLAMARYGANIDRRVISVVQIAPENIKGTSADRPVVVRLQERPNGNRTTLSVTLGWHGQEHTGEATGPSTASTRFRLVGEATLAAIENMIEDAPPLALDSVGSASVGMRRVMIVVVISARGHEEEVVVGSALSSGDESDAVVRAVLDALNRRLPVIGK